MTLFLHQTQKRLELHYYYLCLNLWKCLHALIYFYLQTILLVHNIDLTFTLIKSFTFPCEVTQLRINKAKFV